MKQKIGKHAYEQTPNNVESATASIGMGKWNHCKPPMQRAMFMPCAVQAKHLEWSPWKPLHRAFLLLEPTLAALPNCWAMVRMER